MMLDNEATFNEGNEHTVIEALRYGLELVDRGSWISLMLNCIPIPIMTIINERYRILVQPKRALKQIKLKNKNGELMLPMYQLAPESQASR